MGSRREGRAKKATAMFKGYMARLVFRACLFAVTLAAFVWDRASLDIGTRFGLADGFGLVDFVFCALLADIITKFFPNAKIAMGSLKQYGRYRKTPVSSAHAASAHAARAHVEESSEISPELRRVIRRDRLKEILPVTAFWIVGNAAVFTVLALTGLLSGPVLVLWTVAYALIDMVCVVLWCPLQVIFMKNRCCTTCQIFNWDAIMTVTPLLAAPCLFSGILVALAAVVMVRWEVAFALHPERFDERANAALSCRNCFDKLCQVRPPLLAGAGSRPLQGSPSKIGRCCTDAARNAAQETIDSLSRQLHDDALVPKGNKG